MSTAMPSAYAFFRLETDADNGIEIVYVDGQLIFRVEIDGNHQQVASAAYSASEHRWWRLREQDGAVYWETSSDGADWVAHNQAPSPLPMTALDVLIGAGDDAAVLTAATFEFDNYNVPPPGDGAGQ